MFLTPEEVAYLTGIRGPSHRSGKKLSRNARQAEQLRKMGVPFRVNAEGRPIVTRSAVTGDTDGSDLSPPTWQPAAMRGRAA